MFFCGIFSFRTFPKEKFGGGVSKLVTIAQRKPETARISKSDGKIYIECARFALYSANKYKEHKLTSQWPLPER